MTVVVDASVAVKWILPESDSPAAAALRERDTDLIAPSLVAAEVGNAIWKAVRQGTLGRSDGVDGIEAALSWFQSLIPIEELYIRALTLALDLRHPIYDCFYLALAERESVHLVTTDEGMIAAARRAKVEVRRI